MKHASNVPRILLLDIETSPSLGWFFDYKREYNILETEKEWCILSVGWKWYGENKVFVKALPDFKGYKAGVLDDYKLVEFIHGLFDEAHVIIGHNGDKFDIRRINARLMFHRFHPPAPYKTFDTLKMHRRIADVNSHRLDALARYYSIGHKLPHTGKDLWLGCIRGNMSDWKKMKEYNAHDVHLLDKLYPILRPYAPVHPNLTLYTGKMSSCPRCGGKMQKRGHVVKNTRVYQRYNCYECGYPGWGEVIKLEEKVLIK